MGYESWLPSMPQGLFACGRGRNARFDKRFVGEAARKGACIGEIAVHLRRRKVVVRCGEARE